MKRYTTIGILVGAALLVQASIASAQRWGREATPRSGVCFYEDINFNGRYFCSPVGSVTEGVPSGMNDRISSVRVFGNAVATVYRDPNLRGQAKRSIMTSATCGAALRQSDEYRASRYNNGAVSRSARRR
jgi:hypothetical protein